MRKQIDGLALIVTSQFNMNVLDHSLFIFTKERRKAPRFSHGDIRRSLCSCFLNDCPTLRVLMHIIYNRIIN